MAARQVCGGHRDRDGLLRLVVVAVAVLGVHAVTTGVRGAGPDPPQQVHLALAGDDGAGNSDGMAVSWQTVNDTATSQVAYGLSEDSLGMMADGVSQTYYATYDHHVLLRGLQPATRYFYACGDDAAGWSDEVRSFVTAPQTGAGGDYQDDAFTVAVVGDMGIWNADESMALLQKWSDDEEFDWILHLGDIAYADDSFLHKGQVFRFKYEDTYNTYMNDIESFVSNHAYMVLPGNHEAECHSPACQVSDEKVEKLSNFSAYESRFRMPGEESGGNTNMWFSYNYGPVHFVHINTETNMPNAPGDSYLIKLRGNGNGNFWGDQLAWLQADLQAANENRGERPWVIVSGHRPVYTVMQTDDDGNPTWFAKKTQTDIEQILYDNNVDIYFCGHVHAYERQYPTYQGEPEEDYDQPRAPVYIVHGASGNDEGQTDLSSRPDVAWNAAYYYETTGNAILSVTHDELVWKFYRSTDGTLVDEMTLHKEH